MAIPDVVRVAERTINRIGLKRTTKAGWVPQISGFSGYGSTRRVRVLGRVLMANPSKEADPLEARGWHQFLTIQVNDVPLTIDLGGVRVKTTSDSNGYIDVLIEKHGLSAGWHEVTISGEGIHTTSAEALIVDESAHFGLISDIDDTVLVTWLPRALVAAWNSWIRHTNTRKPVAGMAEFYAEILKDHPGSPVFYLSTGAWNTFDALKVFLAKHRFPTGPMLLTDWGPTPTGLFRSGQEHKKVQLRNLIIEYPEMRWLLIGDDGQHDPLIYGEAVAEHPDRIAGIAIRQLTPGEHILSHGTTRALVEAGRDGDVIFGGDGFELLRAYRSSPLSVTEKG